MMTEVNVGDIVRYEGTGYRLKPVYAVILITEHLFDYDFNVLVLETNIEHLDGPWSFDPAVLDKCELLA